jgi:hypothetical protein
VAAFLFKQSFWQGMPAESIGFLPYGMALGESRGRQVFTSAVFCAGRERLFSVLCFFQ